MNKLIRFGSTYTMPGRAYQPGRPAYTSYATYNYVSTAPQVYGALPAGWVYVQVPTVLPDGTTIINTYPRWTGAGVGSTSPSIAGGNTSTATSIVISTFHPAIPEVLATPTTRVDDPPLGWTSFGHSIKAVRGGLRATFKVPKKTAGIAVGITPTTAPVPGYTHLRNGFVFTGAAAVNLVTGASYGAYDDADTFEVRLRQTTVTLHKNGSLLATEDARTAPGEQLYLGSAMYGAGDFVDSPTLIEEQFGTSTATLHPLTANSGAAGKINSVARFQPLTATSRAGNSSRATLTGMHAQSSDRAYGGSLATLAALEVSSYGGTIGVVPQNTSYAQFSGLAAASLLLVGETGTSTAAMSGLRGLSADRPYGSSVARLQPLIASSREDASDMRTLLSGFSVGVEMRGFSTEALSFLPSVLFGVEMEAFQEADAKVLESIMVGVELRAEGGSETVDVRESFLFGIELTAPGAHLEVWAVNVEGYGSTSYANFPFNSFARIGEHYYGAKEDGLFQLGGDTDSGALIRSAFSPGKLDFGTSQNKTIVETWLGAKSATAMACTLTAEGKQYLYTADSFTSDELEQHRIKFGKGLKANYLRPTFYNQDGADFEVDALEFAIATLSRKR